MMFNLKIWNRLKKEESGQALVLVVLAMTVLLGFTALTIDLGIARIEKNNLQTALDAASLAGVSDLPEKNVAEATAKKVMELNGYTLAHIAGFEYPTANTMKVIGKKEVKFSFAQVLGFSSMMVTESATAEKNGLVSNVFNYTLFSAEGKVTITGNSHVITGDVYGKTGVNISGPHTQLNGKMNAFTGELELKGWGGTGSGYVSTPLTLPDFSGKIAAQGIVFENQAAFDNAYSGKTVDRPIYVKGDLTINGRIRGSGIIYADKITFEDNFQTAEDSIVFYAGGTEGIKINGSKPDVYGIFYAPNGGMTFNGAPQTRIFGRVVVKNNLGVNGSDFIIKSSSNELKGLDTLKRVRLTQ
jgi:hypothetical protein